MRAPRTSPRLPPTMRRSWWGGSLPASSGRRRSSRTRSASKHALQVAAAEITVCRQWIGATSRDPPATRRFRHLDVSRSRESEIAKQHRNIEVSGATLECTLYGSGTPVVLLANAGCSTGYFDDLARALAARGLQAVVCQHATGLGESRGSLDGITAARFGRRCGWCC